jgi:hypothetical protein
MGGVEADQITLYRKKVVEFMVDIINDTFTGLGKNIIERIVIPSLFGATGLAIVLIAAYPIDELRTLAILLGAGFIGIGGKFSVKPIGT